MRHLGVLALAAFILLPLVQAILLSFTATLPGDAQGALGLMNYRHVLATPELRAAMLNSLIYVSLNVALCIALGLPAAYASGYIRTLPPPGEARLVGADATHAWVLLWCGPRHGWVGVDPTNGIWMASDHIVMAVGRDYAEIAPVDGVVLGSGAQDMQVSVDVAPVEDI